MAVKVRLPRKRFFRLNGTEVQLAVGMLLATIAESQAAHASELGDGISDEPNATPADAAALTAKLTPEALGVDAEAIKSMSVDELKALLTPELLAKLELDAHFTDQLDHDLKGAMRDLEAAFRKKLAAAASATTVKGDAPAKDHAGDSDSHGDSHDSDLLSGVSPLLILAGLAVTGTALAFGLSGDDDDDGQTPPVANRVPVATNDTFTVNEDTATTFDVRSNDTDADGDTLTVTQVNGTSISTTTPVTIANVGTVSLGADGRLTFTPVANFNGTPTFTYTLSDGKGGTATGTVNGTVTAVNDVPVAVADTFTMAEDGAAVTINVRGNDTDADNDTLTITQVNGTAITTTTPVTIAGVGVVALTAAGQLTFTPSANYNGTPSFTYTVADGKGGTATATVSGTVTPVNDAPVNAGPASAISAGAGTPVLVNGLSVSDVDGAAGTFTTTLKVNAGTLSAVTVAGGATIGGSGTGTVTISGTLAQVNAALAAVNFTGTASTTLTMTTSDGSVTDVDTFNISVGAVQTGRVQDGYIQGAQVFYDANNNGKYDAGEAVATTDAEGRYSLALPEGATGSIIALGGINVDTGLANTMPLKAPIGSSVVNPLTTLVANVLAAGGTLEQANAKVAASLGLAPGTDFTNFDFLAPGGDPVLKLAIQKQAAMVAQIVNDAVEKGVDPTALINAISNAANSGTPVDLTKASDLSALLTTAGASAEVASSVSNAASAVNNAISQATDPSKITDVQHEYNQPGANLPPVADDDSATTTIGTAVTIAALDGDVDADGNALSITKIGDQAITAGNSVTLPQGIVTLNADGTLTFTPAVAFIGSVSFDYTLSDGSAATTGSVTVDVQLAGSSVAIATADLNAFIDNAAALAAAGLTTISIDTDDVLLISAARAALLVASGIEIVMPDEALGDLRVLVASQGDMDALPDPAALVAAGIEEVAVSAPVTVSEAYIKAMLAADLEFDGVDFDTDAAQVTIQLASGTTTLSLFELGGVVDGASIKVAPGATALTLVLGEGGLQELTFNDADDLPRFNVAQSDASLAVTVVIDAGTLPTNLVLTQAMQALKSIGVDVLTTSGGPLVMNATQASAIATAGIDIADAVDLTLNIAGAQAAGLLSNAGFLNLLSALDVDHINAAGPAVLTAVQVQALASRGVDFLDANAVQVTATGSLATSLRTLQQVNVDTVLITGSTLLVNAGGGLADLAGDSLPRFVGTQGANPLVTLQFDTNGPEPTADVSAFASSLVTAGIDQISTTSGSMSLTATQALAFTSANLDIVDAVDLTVSLDNSQLGSAIDALGTGDSALRYLDADHLDLVSNVATISDAQASTLLAAGIDFVDSDAVTLSATGTHLSTSLKGLQSLNVDTVIVAGSGLVVDAGASLSAITADSLPTFVSDGGVVTLNLAGGIDSSLNLGGAQGIAQTLANAGIDSLSVAGGNLSLTTAQADALAAANVDVLDAVNLSLNVSTADVHNFAAHGDTLGYLDVDHLDVIGDAVTISDVEAHALIGAGVDFVESDSVTVSAAGTHLSTSLKDLQSLNVDTVLVAGGAIVVDAGVDLGALTADALPHFTNVAPGTPGTDTLDVTLNIAGGGITPGVDASALAQSLAAAGVDHINSANGFTLTYAQASALGAAGIDFTSASAVTVELAPTDTIDLDMLHTLQVDHIDWQGTQIDLTADSAQDLIDAGIDFVESDQVVMHATGTHVSTTLKGLSDLNVDTVLVAGSAIVVEAGADLGALAADGLPHFTNVEPGTLGIDTLDVTLDIAGGGIAPGVDVSALAQSLAAAGIDHINSANDFTLTYAQAAALGAAGIDFTSASAVTVQLAPSDTVSIDMLQALNVDHIDWQGAQIDLTADSAQDLIDAGIDFVESDQVVMHATGTHVSTTLKGLSDLNVDTVLVGGNGHLIVDAGALAGAFAADTLPHFALDANVPVGTNLDVTLLLQPGTIDPGTDFGTFAQHLETAGVDHLGVANNGALTLSLDNALTLADAGVDFAPEADITVNLNAAQIGTLTGNPMGVAEFGIDHLHVAEGSITLQDDQASALVQAGVDFVHSDSVTVEAQGTHLSTSLKDLQTLHVDAISVGAAALHLDAGDLTGISAADLPQFDTKQSDAALDVTLRVDAGQLDTLQGLAGALRAAGIDHFSVDQPLESYDGATQAKMAAIASASQIDFVYEEPTVSSMSLLSSDTGTDTGFGGEVSLFAQLAASFDAHEDNGVGGQIVVEDGVKSLAESGMLRGYTAEKLVLDGTGSGDTLHSTLKDIAHFGVDQIMSNGGPLLVDAGLLGSEGVQQVADLFRDLDLNVQAPNGLFDSHEKVVLVVEQDVAHAIAQVEGGFEKLAAIGFTDLDVLMANTSAPDIHTDALDVKVIGPDDDLYWKFHHDR